MRAHSTLFAMAAALVCTVSATRAAEVPGDDAKKPLEFQATEAEAAWLARVEAGDWITSRTTARLDGEASVVTDARRSVWRVRDEDDKDNGRTRAVEIKEEAALGGNTSATACVYRLPAPKGDRGAAPASADRFTQAYGREIKDKDKRKIAGKTVNCRVYERTVEAGPRKVKIRTWHTPGLPFDGVARIEHDGKVVYEVLDFGRGK